MNFELLGNLVPRYYGDPTPGKPIDTDAQAITLAASVYQERVRLIQESLSLLGDSGDPLLES